MPLSLFGAQVENFEPSEKRAKIIGKLQEKYWFRDTDFPTALELITLPQEGRENHDGFLEDLAGRPEAMGGLTVLRMERLARGNYMLIPVFKVRNQEGKEYFYEYVSWRYGSMPGAKGIVFVREGTAITHFIVLRGESFAIGGPSWDLTGGALELGVDGVTTIEERIEREIQEELGQTPGFKVKSLTLLGSVALDQGMTNSHSLLFAAVIDSAQADLIPESEFHAEDTSLKARPVVFPIEDLKEMMMDSTDAIFLSAVSRCLVHGIISPEVLLT